VRVAAHATSDAAVWNAAAAGVASVEHAYQVADSTLALMAKNGVFMVPTDIDSIGFVLYMKKAAVRNSGETMTPAQIHEALEPQRDRLRRAIKAGVQIAAGSDNYIDMAIPQGEASRRVLFAYGQAGVPNAMILQAATINAAKLLGRENRLGVIKQGAMADIIAVEGDPLKELSALERVRYVMKDGTVYVGDRRSAIGVRTVPDARD
jgi:imidazolonepropionase-like amidohydrolase